jgi:hypothetical protein
MADVEWQPLPVLWPEPAVWTDVGQLMLLVFTQDGVPTWEVNRRVKTGSRHYFSQTLIARTSAARSSTGIVGNSPWLLTGRLRR